MLFSFGGYVARAGTCKVHVVKAKPEPERTHKGELSLLCLETRLLAMRGEKRVNML